MNITVDYKLLAVPVKEAGSLENLIFELLKNCSEREALFVNSVFMVEGHEYNLMKKRVSAFAQYFSSIEYGKAILGNSSRIKEFANFILDAYKIQNNKEYVFVGHGSKDSENIPYRELQKVFDDKGFSNVKIAVLKGKGNLEDYLKIIIGNKITSKIEAYPLLINSGEHIKTDVAEFCKEVFNAGFEIEYHQISLSENLRFKELYLK